MTVFKSPYKQLNRKINTWCRYTKRLDTYGLGCQHDCKYCYAKGLLEFRGHWNVDGQAEADLYKIKCLIRRLNPGDVVRLGGMTDCFQPLEATKRLTYFTILILNQFRISYLIVTKSAMVADEKYMMIYDKDLAHFQISITATSDLKCIEYEKSSVTSKRIKAIEKLQTTGFDVSVRLSPFIEPFVDTEIVNQICCNKILIEFLKVNHWVRKRFDIDYSDYTLKYGGYENLQLDKKIELVERITGFDQVSVGEYVRDHHEYFSENVNHNKEDCCNLRFNRKRVEIIQLRMF